MEKIIIERLVQYSDVEIFRINRDNDLLVSLNYDSYESCYWEKYSKEYLVEPIEWKIECILVKPGDHSERLTLEGMDYSFGQIKMKDKNLIQFIEYDYDEDSFTDLVYNVNKNKIFDQDELFVAVDLSGRIKKDTKKIMCIYFNTILLKEADDIVELRINSEDYVELAVNGAQCYYSKLDEFNSNLDKHVENIAVELNKIYQELQNLEINDYIINIEDSKYSVSDIVCRITLTRDITVEGFADDEETAKSQALQNIKRLIKMIKYFANAIS